MDGCISTVNDLAKSADNWFHIAKQGKAGDERERLKARSQVELARGLTRHPALTQQVVLPFGVTVGRLVPQKCFVLTSAAKPLWLSFEAPEAYDFFDSLDQNRYEAFPSGVPPRPSWMWTAGKGAGGQSPSPRLYDSPGRGGSEQRNRGASFDVEPAPFNPRLSLASKRLSSTHVAELPHIESGGDRATAGTAAYDPGPHDAVLEDHDREYQLHHGKEWDAVMDPASGHYYYVGIADPSIVVWTLPEGTTEDHINYEHGYDEPEAPVEDGYSSRASLVAAQSRML